MPRLPKGQPEWMARLRIGDVLKSANGSYRVVREINRHPASSRVCAGWLRSVTFSIKHCSWTGKCYTVLTATDLKQRGFAPVGARVKLTKPIDTAVLACIRGNDGANGKSLRCCDVRDIA